VAGTYNIVCDQGSTFRRDLIYSGSDGVPIDNTGMSARMQVRPKEGSGTVLLSLTTENGGLILGGADGSIQIVVSAVQMALVPAGKHRYDLELVNSGEVMKPVRGAFFVRAEVTK